jgi:protein SCO1
MESGLLRGCVVLLVSSLCISDSALAQSRAGVTRPRQASSEQVTYRGGLVTPPLSKPDIILTDTSGNAYDLRSKTQGYVTLLFFGYTRCTDVCPLHMAYLASALKKLPVGSAQQIRVVFVTTDPAQDNSQRLRAWLNHFDKSFIGLTGSEAEIAAAQIAAGLSPASKSMSLSGVADFGHAAFVIAYTKDNWGHLIYPSGTMEEDWVHDLPALVAETW